MKINSKDSPRATPKQWAFAQLLAAQSMSMTDCYRLIYLPKNGTRRASTERVNAMRLARHPSVIWAVQQISAGPKLPVRVERLKQKVRAMTRRRAIHQILQERGRRAEVILAGRQVQRPSPRKRAWVIFLRALHMVERARPDGRPPLTAEQRTAILFERFAPSLSSLSASASRSTSPLPSLSPALPTREDEAEIEQVVRERGARARTPRLEPAPPTPDPPAGPRPGCFPPPEPVEAGDDYLMSIARLRRGALQRRRLWVPADKSSGDEP